MSYKTKYTKGQLVRVKQKTLWITKAKSKITEQMYKNFKPKKAKQENRHITYLL